MWRIKTSISNSCSFRRSKNVRRNCSFISYVYNNLSNIKIKQHIICRKHNKCKSNHKLKRLNSPVSYRIFKTGWTEDKIQQYSTYKALKYDNEIRKCNKITAHETNRQSRFDAGYRMLGAGALGWPRGMGWGGRREGSSGWGTRVHPWRIHVDVRQNQYNIVK